MNITAKRGLCTVQVPGINQCEVRVVVRTGDTYDYPGFVLFANNRPEWPAEVVEWQDPIRDRIRAALVNGAGGFAYPDDKRIVVEVFNPYALNGAGSYRPDLDLAIALGIVHAHASLGNSRAAMLNVPPAELGIDGTVKTTLGAMIGLGVQR